MKRALLLFLLVAACQNAAPTGAPEGGSAGAPRTGVVDVCAFGRRALIGLDSCAGKPIGEELAGAKRTFVGVVDTVKQTSPGAAETTCAQMLYALDGELGKLGCPLVLSAPERTRMLDLVEAWYAVRTPVALSGNAAADEIVARVAKVRDAACACETDECLAKVQEQFDTLGQFAPDAPASAQELGRKLLDDVGRCGARIRKPVRR
ncbi:MAG: hypothetical protein H0T79_01725 [Deltaproteobacteria bacterium]|nr:hypothetical protein [Deltaproteobacteria bacterium]